MIDRDLEEDLLLHQVIEEEVVIIFTEVDHINNKDINNIIIVIIKILNIIHNIIMHNKGHKGDMIIIMLNNLINIISSINNSILNMITLHKLLLLLRRQLRKGIMVSIRDNKCRGKFKVHNMYKMSMVRDSMLHNKGAEGLRESHSQYNLLNNFLDLQHNNNKLNNNSNYSNCPSAEGSI